MDEATVVQMNSYFSLLDGICNHFDVVLQGPIHLFIAVFEII